MIQALSFCLGLCNLLSDMPDKNLDIFYGIHHKTEAEHASEHLTDKCSGMSQWLLLVN